MTRKTRAFAALSALLLAPCAGAAATITAADGLDLVDALSLANEVFTAEDGAVIRVAEPETAEAGLLVRKGEQLDGLAQMRQLHDPFTGKDWGARTNLIFDVTVTNGVCGTWAYRGRWYAPSTGSYSFATYFDDRCGLLIDGRPVVSTDWSLGFRAVRDVALAQGWHDIEVAFVNVEKNMGPRDGLPKGLVWSADNVAFTAANIGEGNLFEDPGDGSSLRGVRNGAFCRRLDIPSGTATLDLTRSGLAGPFCFGSRTGLRTGAGAKLLVKGASELVFNGAGDGIVHFPLLDADVAFEGNPDGRVRIYGKVSVERMRPNYVLEDGAEVAYWGTNMVVDAEWTLTNRNAYILSTAAFAPQTRLVVAHGSTLTLKPCEHNPSDTWNWRGIAGTFANDFELRGAGAVLALRAYRALELSGRISGDGRINVVEQGNDGPARLTGDLTDFAGTLRVYENGQVVVEGTLPADGLPRVELGVPNVANGVVTIRPEGAGEVETSAAIARVQGFNETAYAMAVEKQEVSIGTFGGTGGLKTANLTDSHITVEALEAGATLVLRWTANVTVRTAGAGAKAKAVGNAWFPARLELSAGCELPVLEIVDGAVVTLAGAGRVARVEGVGTLNVEPGVEVGGVAPGVNLRLPENGVLRDVDAAALASALGANGPALWLDASRADTFQQYYACAFTNGMILRRWNDCRAEQTGLYGLNPRGEGYMRVYPYVMTNALHGMDVVSMGKVGGRLAPEYGHMNEVTGVPDTGDTQPETRRLPFNRPIRVRTAIVVFGSQMGGGGAILGGDTDQGVRDLRGTEASEWTEPATKCSFWRGTAEVADYSNPATPIFSRYRNTWVDGMAVDPTKTGYSGGWQVVSFESETEDGEEVRSLGMLETYENSGGQNYAEVLIYTNALTAAERRAVELHLARKWGLAWGALPLNGAGRVEVADILPAEGSYAGTVDVAAGGVLDLGAAPRPMREAEIPSEGRVGWFDPDEAASLELGGETEPGMENCIYGIFDRGKERVNGTPYLHGTYNAAAEAGGNGDRRPRAVRGAHGDGPARTWMHFHEDPSDGGGNTLRAKTDPSLLRLNRGPNYSNVTLPTRTAFIVSDSTYGGGVPIADTVGINGLVKRRNVSYARDPIWAKGTTATLSNGVTRLDGRGVNGFTTGFSGGPELLSFTATEAFPAAFFGSCGTGAGERSYELLGEILLYDREIAGAERDRIEAYLMNKWLGRLPGGWCDWRRATVTGAGTVKAPSADVLPGFAADFAGTVELAGGLTFHVDAAGVVTDRLVLPAGATLKLPAAGAVEVSFADAPRSCTLATAGAVVGFEAANWTVQAVPETRGTCRLECADGELRFVVVPNGTAIFIR